MNALYDVLDCRKQKFQNPKRRINQTETIGDVHELDHDQLLRVLNDHDAAAEEGRRLVCLCLKDDFEYCLHLADSYLIILIKKVICIDYLAIDYKIHNRYFPLSDLR